MIGSGSKHCGSATSLRSALLAGTALIGAFAVTAPGVASAQAVINNPAGSTILNPPGPTGPVNNAGNIGNGGSWTGNVITNTGNIGNAGLWTGNVVSNAGNIGNVGQWLGNAQNNRNIGNNGAWNGTISNGVTGVLVTGDASAVSGLVTNNGVVLAYGGKFNGGVQNNAVFTLPGAGSFDAGAVYGPVVARILGGALSGSGAISVAGPFTNTNRAFLTITPGARLSVSGGTVNTGTVISYGSLSGGLTNAGSVYAGAGALNGAIGNTGLLDVAGAVASDADVTNAGSLAVTGTGAYAIAGSLNNSGTVFVDKQASLTDDLTNTGAVINTGTFNANVANNAVGVIFNSGTWNGNIVNAGAIYASGAFNGNVINSGAFSSTSATISQTLTNSGTITVTANGATTNSLTAASYVGTAGSKAYTNVDLSAGAGQASTFTFNSITGAAGATTLVVQNVGGPVAYHPTVAVVNGADPGNVFQVTQANLDQLKNGFVSYSYGNGQLVGNVSAPAAGSVGIQVASIVTTLASDFFQDWQPFITAPQDPDPNSISGGPWVRGKYGRETIDATAFANGANPTPSRVATEFSGFQVGADVGVFNIDKTGWNLIAGITGGEVFATETERLAGNIKGVYQIPFFGAYFAATNGPFHADVLYRHDFYGISLNDPSDGLLNQGLKADGDSVSMDAGYSFALGSFGTMGNFFIEPNGSLIVSEVKVDPLNFARNNLGVLRTNAIDSLLGRAGFRFGTSLTVDKLALQPFMTASVWHEFDDNATSAFDPVGGAATVPLSVTRVGTFGQFGVGLNGELLGSNVLGTVRADFRVGDKVDGQSVTAQLRYQF